MKEQRHLRHLSQANLQRGAVVTIGVFDGVHLGHQSLIRRLVESARERQLAAVALTFFPHPDKTLRQVEARYYLTTPRQRADLLLGLGLDWIITHPFDEATRLLSARDFVEMLSRHLRMRELWVGAGFALGHKREGNVEVLSALGQDRGFRVVSLDLLAQAGGAISSSQLRQSLLRGDMGTVKRLLGRAYALPGEVVKGVGRGKSIGMPTANIEVWDEQIIPPNGVYAGFATVAGERYLAAINIGSKPTFGGESHTIEAHLLDFDSDIYGAKLDLSFEARLRSERAFESVDSLLAQIRRDIDRTRELLQDSQRD